MGRRRVRADLAVRAQMRGAPRPHVFTQEFTLSELRALAVGESRAHEKLRHVLFNVDLTTGDAHAAPTPERRP